MEMSLPVLTQVFEKMANDYFGIKKDDKTKDNVKKVEAKGINLILKNTSKN